MSEYILGHTLILNVDGLCSKRPLITGGGGGGSEVLRLIKGGNEGLARNPLLVIYSQS